MKIQANNIETTTPNGKISYNHLHNLHQLLPLILGKYIDTPSEVIEVFDRKFKGTVLAKKFSSGVILPKEFEDIKVKLENNEVVEINNWKFKLV